MKMKNNRKKQNERKQIEKLNGKENSSVIYLVNHKIKPP